MQKMVKTNPQTTATYKSPCAAAKKAGNAGNTKHTRLPNGGCPRGAKKMSRKGY